MTYSLSAHPAASYRPRHIRRIACQAMGFSLVELSIVVLIASILLTMGLAAFNAQLDTASLSATQRKQETIKEALIAYLRTNRRLPCPETTAFGGSPPTGAETGGATTTCDSFWGTVPFATLGLSRETALDGYGNFFTYFVSSAANTFEPDWTLTAAPGVPGFSVGNPGRFSITERTATGTLPTTQPANLAAVVIVSHGKNGSGAFTLKGTRIPSPPLGTDESENAPDTTANTPPAWTAPAGTGGCGGTCPSPGIRILFIKSWTDDAAAPGGLYDDVVLVLRPNDLLGPIIKDGALKSAEALVQEQLTVARDTAIAEMLANSCTPKSPLSATLPTDPWGSPIQYTRLSSDVLTASTPPSSDNAFEVLSFGPNRVSGGGDDVFLQASSITTYGQIRSRIPPTACP